MNTKTTQSYDAAEAAIDAVRRNGKGSWADLARRASKKAAGWAPLDAPSSDIPDVNPYQTPRQEKKPTKE
jgi:hypothetical protein